MQQLIYTGPNVQRLGLLRYQVYLHGIPGQVKAAMSDYPEIEKFIVPIDKLSEMTTKISISGTHEHHLYKEFKRKVVR